MITAFLMALVLLLAAHALADGPLQRHPWFRHKKDALCTLKGSGVLALHMMTHAVLAAAALTLVGLSPSQWLVPVYFIGWSHGVIDSRPFWRGARWVKVDQGLHIAIIAVVSAMVVGS